MVAVMVIADDFGSTWEESQKSVQPRTKLLFGNQADANSSSRNTPADTLSMAGKGRSPTTATAAITNGDSDQVAPDYYRYRPSLS